MKEVISKKEMGVSRYSSFILGLLFLVIQGCAGVGPDLEKAKEQNTEQAYLAFIEKYQDQSAASEQIKEARKAIILSNSPKPKRRILWKDTICLWTSTTKTLLPSNNFFKQIN